VRIRRSSAYQIPNFEDKYFEEDEDLSRPVRRKLAFDKVAKMMLSPTLYGGPAMQI
jgi:hypothetical protein